MEDPPPVSQADRTASKPLQQDLEGQAEKGKAGRVRSRTSGKCEESREAQGEGSGQLSPTLAALGGGGGCTQANKDSADKANVTQSHACAKMSQQC